MARVPRYRLTDSAQQLIGGFLLAGPFVVTQEVWALAENMTLFHAAGTAVIVLAIGYTALYHAPKNRRDPDEERRIFGIPARFLSLVLVAYGAVIVLIYLFTAPQTFQASTVTTAKAVSAAAIFSVIGAATADSLF